MPEQFATQLLGEEGIIIIRTSSVWYYYWLYRCPRSENSFGSPKIGEKIRMTGEVNKPSYERRKGVLANPRARATAPLYIWSLDREHVRYISQSYISGRGQKIHVTISMTWQASLKDRGAPLSSVEESSESTTLHKASNSWSALRLWFPSSSWINVRLW